jgi:hypothetical protein
MVIEWRHVLMSVVIAFFLGAALAVAWGICGMMIFASIGDDAERLYESPLAHLGGWLVGLIPIAAGTVYLVKSIDSNYVTHCLIFVGINIAISIVFIFAFPDDDNSWGDIVYYLAMFPVSLMTCVVARRSQ